MSIDRGSLLVFVLLVSSIVGMTVAPVGATPGGGESTRGEPDLDVYLAENQVTAGTETTLEFEIQNDGEMRTGVQSDRVLPARGVTATIDDAGPFDLHTAEMPLGTIQNGQIAVATQRLTVPDGVEPGTYEVSLEVSYSYTDHVTDYARHTRDKSRTETFDLTVEVLPESTFEIRDGVADVEPGGSGEATFEIENVGDETANDTRVALTGTGGVVVDGGSAEEYLGTLGPGNTTTITVDAAVEEGVSSGTKPLDAVFTYTDEAGLRHESEPVVASLPLGGGQSFSIDGLQDTLSVGYDGVVTGEVTNDGPRAVDDAVLIVEPQSDSLFVEDTRYALPPLEPGETVAFSYPTDVSGQADAGPRQLRFSVEYTSGSGTLVDGPHSQRVVVDERTDEFSIADDGVSVRQGGSSEFVLEITNERPETLSNIEAMLYTSGPLHASNDDAFVAELESGESAEIAFELSAAADAATETHPIELDFQYQTERGNTELSHTYMHPIEVTPGEDDDGGGISGMLVGAVSALAVAGLGIGLWWRQGS